MASFGTQFHALLDELGDFLAAWIVTYPITAIAIEFWPKRRYPLTRENLREVLARPAVARIFLTLEPVDPSIVDNSEIIKAHPNALVFDIGRVGPRGLEQSSLSTMDANPIWRKINSDLKRKATTGADFVHEENGAKGVERIFRFTPGARALSKAGTPLRAFAQSPVVYYPK